MDDFEAWEGVVRPYRAGIITFLALVLSIGTIAAPTCARAQYNVSQKHRRYTVTPGQSLVEDEDFAARVDWSRWKYRLYVDDKAEPYFDGNPWSGETAEPTPTMPMPDALRAARLSTFRRRKFLPLALLEQKAKVFNDGLYAAVEIAAQEGAGNYAGKRALFAALMKRLEEVHARPNEAVCRLFAAASLGDPRAEVPAAYLDCGKKIQREAESNNPISFYTWSDDLGRIWRQDTTLQEGAEWDEGIDAVVAALQNDEMAKTNYVQYLDLISRLTNPPVDDPKGLRPYLKPGAKPPKDDAPVKYVDTGLLLTRQEPRYAIFPPLRSHEIDLLNRLLPPDTEPPPDFNLMEEFIHAIRSRSIKLKPKPASGWYDYQTYALETLVAPERSAEAARLILNDAYRKHLESIFKGSMALNREIHVKNLGITSISEGITLVDRPVTIDLTIRPKLSLEPTLTHYLRQADAIRFIESVLVEAFGQNTLDEMHRMTMDGPVSTSLAQELRDMRALFLGAARIGADEIGMPVERLRRKESLPVGSAADEDVFRNWSSKVFEQSDPDLTRDLRMMVPVFYDGFKEQWRVWAFLGWEIRSLSVSFERAPTVKILRKPPGVDVHVSTSPLFLDAFSPVVREIYVKTILNRDEFRRLCDKKQTPEAIVAALVGNEPIPPEPEVEPPVGDDDAAVPEAPADDLPAPPAEDDAARACCGV